MQLSRFFTLAEMTRSDAAARRGIANQPDETATNHLKALCAAVLDPLRDGINAPINVNSGYRGPELNVAIGGAKKSQHMEGKAADIQTSAMSVLDLFKAVIRLGLPFDQVIYEAKSRASKWVHVSHDSTRPLRGQIMVANFDDAGRVSYRTISVQDAMNMSEPATRDVIELEYEELPDEPEMLEEQAPPEAAAPKKPAPKKAAAVKPKAPAKKAKAKAAPKKKKAVAKRKSPAKGKAKPKAKAKGKTAKKRARPKPKKHK